jgi:hypothetical protein
MHGRQLTMCVHFAACHVVAQAHIIYSSYEIAYSGEYLYLFSQHYQRTSVGLVQVCQHTIYKCVKYSRKGCAVWSQFIV